jgi:hypothetical protein
MNQHVLPARSRAHLRWPPARVPPIRVSRSCTEGDFLPTFYCILREQREKASILPETPLLLGAHCTLWPPLPPSSSSCRVVRGARLALVRAHASAAAFIASESPDRCLSVLCLTRVHRLAVVVGSASRAPHASHRPRGQHLDIETRTGCAGRTLSATSFVGDTHPQSSSRSEPRARAAITRPSRWRT